MKEMAAVMIFQLCYQRAIKENNMPSSEIPKRWTHLWGGHFQTTFFVLVTGATCIFLLLATLRLGKRHFELLYLITAPLLLFHSLFRCFPAGCKPES